MSKAQSRSDSSEDEFEDDAALQDGQWPSQQQIADNLSPSHPSTAKSPDQAPKPILPLQKRRRVTRACDECRRKKIKCDGKQPCTHCTVYSYECTYDQPSNRRRNPAPHYVEALEIKLQRAEAIIKAVLPETDLDDPNADSAFLPRNTPVIKREHQSGNASQVRSWATNGRPQDGVDGDKDSMLESMVENTGSLDLDDEGYWDFHGHSSGKAFLRKMREQFGDLIGKAEGNATPFMKHRSGSHPLNSPIGSSVSSPMASKMPNGDELPSKQCARLLCQNALDDACAILRFVHQPTFYAMFDRVYDNPSEDYTSEEYRFLPLLYSVLALGSVFATAEQGQLMTSGFETAIDQGYHWFRASRQMMDVTDCRDLMSLQTILFMIMFLQCSARLSTCYSHIGIVLRSSIRMGLHRSVPNAFNPIEQEVRKRVFWCVRKLDTYTGALLGLPKMLSDDDIDQEQPLEVDDDYITTEEILPMPPGRPSLMAAFNAHTRIVEILAKTVKYIYPLKGNKSKGSQSYIVSHAKIREIEQDLQQWMESLPLAFRPGGEAPPEFARIQQLLRMAYAHIEMVLYRPFLHYVSQDVQAKNFDKRSYACAAACVSVSRNIVHLTADMKRKHLLVGSYWFYMYTTFFAVISLIFYVLENPQNATSSEILKDAHEGRDTLAGLSANSLAADRCSRMLADLFEQLPERLKEARMNSSLQKKRQVPSQLNSAQPHQTQSIPDMRSGPKLSVGGGNIVRRAKTSPTRQDSWGKRSSVSNDASTPRLSLAPGFDPRYSRPSQDQYSSSNTGSADMQTPESANNNLPPQYNFHTNLSGHGVPDLSAMMFPSADPFAYPNQPMTTLENQQSVKEENMSPHMYNLGSSSTTNPPYDSNLDAQIFGGVSPFNMMQNQQGGFGLQSMPPMSMNSTEASQNAMAPPANDSGGWLQQRTGGTPGINIDQLFGEDWGGWMNQGYRQ